MANIFDKLNDLENAEIIFNYYVYYDPHTGSVLHIRNYEEIDLYPHIVVLSSELPEKNRNLSDFLVLEKNGEFKLTNKKIDLIKFDIDQDIHMIEKIKDANSPTFDILIKQDNQEKKFYFIMSDVLVSRLENLWKREKDIIMYVTAENDPNILYSTIRFDAFRLIKYSATVIDFDDGYDGATPCTIFTRKLFQNYKHWDMR